MSVLILVRLVRIQAEPICKKKLNFKIEFQFIVRRLKFNSFFANLRGSHAHEALTPVRTTSCFTDTLKSTAGRRKIENCTDDGTLSAHVSRASLEQAEAHISCKLFLLTCSRCNEILRAVFKAEYSQGAVRVRSRYLQISFLEFALKPSRTSGTGWILCTAYGLRTSQQKCPFLDSYKQHRTGPSLLLFY